MEQALSDSQQAENGGQTNETETCGSENEEIRER